MELRNTPPRPPLHERDTLELVEDLCIALRDVAIRDSDLPDGARVVASIGEVNMMAAILGARKHDVRPRLDQLADETGWQMVDLFASCLAYPATIPYVKLPDGLRRYFRCGCREREVSDNANGELWLCDRCLQEAAEVARTGQASQRFMLYRSDDPYLWCVHVDSATLMVTERDEYWYDFPGYCRICLENELARRQSAERTDF